MKVALCMIAWNEADVIARAIESASGIVDACYVVIDDRTTDNTKEVVEQTCKKYNLEYDISQSPWVGFDYNRNLSFSMAREHKADWGIILDADEVITYNEINTTAIFNEKEWGYESTVEYGGQTFSSIRIVNLNKPWEYMGKIHNYLSCEGLQTTPVMPDIRFYHYHDGYRSKDPNKIERDVEILRECVKEDPGNSRYWFYYAQTLRENGQWDESIDAYKKRMELGGWSEELFYSRYMIGCMYEWKGDFDNALKWYMDAFDYRPSRSEPMYYATVMARNHNKRQLAYMFSSSVISNPFPSDALFIEDEIYNYMMAFEHAISLYYVGKYQESYDLNKALLSIDLPSHVRSQIIENMGYSAIKLGIKDEVKVPVINLFDNSFSYSMNQFGFDSCTHGVKQDDIQWTRDNMEYDGKTIFTDFTIDEKLINDVRCDDKSLWLLEPRSRKPEIYKLCEDLSEKVNKIYTYDNKLLHLGNAVCTPAGGCWVSSEIDDNNPLPFDKSKLVSMVTSKKNDNQYHALRLELAKLFEEKVDVFGLNQWVTPNTYLHDYMFSVVVENDMQDHYFTEKLINCFRKQVIPIYVASKGIGRYFNEKGIIFCQTKEDVSKALKIVNSAYYWNHYDAVKENYLLAERYLRREQILRRKIDGVLWDNPFDYFDRIYFLCSPDPQRRKNIEKLIDTINPKPYTIFNATMHEQGGLGCKLSYRAIIKDAKENGWEKIFVFEDDVELRDDWKYQMTKCINDLQYMEWDHFKLAGNQKESSSFLTPYLYRINFAYSTYACAFHQRIYDKILNDINDDYNQEYIQYVDAFDRYLNEQIIPNGKSYICAKNVCHLIDAKSLIEDSSSIDVNKLIHDSHIRSNRDLIYYNDAMRTFGDNYCRNYSFVRIPLDYTDIDGLFWFGVYFEDELDKLISTVCNINFHWCGSDVLWMIDHPKMEKLRKKRNIHFTCENYLAQQELQSVGLYADVAPMFSDRLDDFTPSDRVKDYDVLVYTPNRHELYNVPMMVEVAKEMPDVRFAFIGDDGSLLNLPKNVTNFQWVNQAQVKDILERSKIYLRITQHDGFADLIIKSQLCGLHVITNYDYPYVEMASDKQTIKDKINLLKDLPKEQLACEFYKSGFINNWEKIMYHGFNKF